MDCKVCGNKLPDGAKFCGNCGTKVEVETHKVCAACGAKNEIGSVFCSSCGTRMVAAEPAKAAPVVEEAPVVEAAPVVEEVVVAEEAVVEAPVVEAFQPAPVAEKKEVFPLIQKICRISSQSLLMLGSLLALIFVFMIGVTTAIEPAQYGFGMVTEEHTLFSFVDMFDAVEYMNGDWSIMHYMMNASYTVLLTLAAIICMLIFFIIGTIKFIINMVKGTTEKLNKWGLTCILFFFTIATIFFAFNNLEQTATYAGQEISSYTTFGSACKIGIIVLCVIAILAVGAHIATYGLAPWTNKKNLVHVICAGAGLIVVGVLLGLLQNAGAGYTTEMAGYGESVKETVFGGYFSFGSYIGSQPWILEFEEVMYSGMGYMSEEFVALESNYMMFNAFSILSQVLVVVVAFLTFGSFGAQLRAVEGEKKAGLGRPITLVVFGALLLLCHYMAVSNLVTLYTELNGGAEAFEMIGASVSGSYITPIIIFVLTLVNLASFIVRKVFIGKENKQSAEVLYNN